VEDAVRSPLPGRVDCGVCAGDPCTTARFSRGKGAQNLAGFALVLYRQSPLTCRLYAIRILMRFPLAFSSRWRGHFKITSGGERHNFVL